MNCFKGLILASCALLILVWPALAHFGTIIPSDDIISQGDSRILTLGVKFIHPLEGHYMEMARPQQFGVLHSGRKVDLLESLKAAKGKSSDQQQGFTFWTTDFTIKRPGDYTFFLEPTPYWEPAEDLFIIHYTKVCVNALGLEKGWDEPLGLETEIVPLTRPYGLWVGNLFSGRVLLKGQPLPFAEVEVEYLNEAAETGGQIAPPADPFVTQVVKADANGVFHYVMPKSGWWGFSALSEADWKLQHNGSDKSVELGAVYWVHATQLP